MYNLPKSILIKIYEFDLTYKLIYNKVMSEFIKRTPYWCMASNLRINDNVSKNNYSMTYKQAKNKSEFWNKRYNYISSLGNKKNNYIITVLPEYISDIHKEYPYFKYKKYRKYDVK